jgi:hypothetical protein
MPSQVKPSSDERLDTIEQLIATVVAKAREHPVGRKILAYLGIE